VIFVDSGYLVALAKPRDSLHDRASRWAECVDEPLVLTDCVLLEAINFLSHPGDRAKADALYDEIVNGSEYDLVCLSAQLLASAMGLHRERPDKEWSLTDCISFQVMNEQGLTQALAYDHHFEQAGFEALLRRDPPSCRSTSP
jgi:uncharacterized protein